jgi:hypothetical protein
MANLAGDEMTCWPSYRHLTDATCQDVKTVEAGIRRLREAGFISDTGERKGSTGQVIVYRLNTPEFGGLQPQSNTPEIPVNTPKSGAVIEAAKTPVFPDNTPVFPVKDPQISHETPPKTGDGTIKEPSRTPQEPKVKKRDEVELLGDVDPQMVADYIAVRKAKSAGPLTATAVRILRREAAKAGLTAEQAVEFCCEASWQGFNAGWYAKRTDTSSPTSKQGGKHAGFATKNYTEGVNADGSFV